MEPVFYLHLRIKTNPHGGLIHRPLWLFIAFYSLLVMRSWYSHHLLHKTKPEEWPTSAMPLGDAIMGLLLVFTLPSSIIFPRTRSFQSAFYRTLSTVVSHTCLPSVPFPVDLRLRLLRLSV
jgi:hypothetical protein